MSTTNIKENLNALFQQETLSKAAAKTIQATEHGQIHRHG